MASPSKAPKVKKTGDAAPKGPSTMSLIKEALAKTEEKRGLTYYGIRSYINEHYPEAAKMNGFLFRVKKALKRGLEEGEFKRPKKDVDQVSHAKGRYKLVVLKPKKVSKKAAENGDKPAKKPRNRSRSPKARSGSKSPKKRAPKDAAKRKASPKPKKARSQSPSQERSESTNGAKPAKKASKPRARSKTPTGKAKVGKARSRSKTPTGAKVTKAAKGASKPATKKRAKSTSPAPKKLKTPKKAVAVKKPAAAKPKAAKKRAASIE